MLAACAPGGAKLTGGSLAPDGFQIHGFFGSREVLLHGSGDKILEFDAGPSRHQLRPMVKILGKANRGARSGYNFAVCSHSRTPPLLRKYAIYKDEFS
jgi:hypothetical protein